MRPPIIKAILTAALMAAAPAFGGTFRQAPPQNAVPDVYIVVLAENVAAGPNARQPNLPSVAQVAQSLGNKHDGKVDEIWEHALQGFVIRMPEARARKLAEDPRVESVEQNAFISTPVGDCYFGTTWADTRTLPSPNASTQLLTCSDPDPLNDTQTGPPLCKDNWGIDRIDQTSATRNNQYAFINNGGGTHVYVMDTGIRWTHREFLNASGVTRVSGGVDARQNPVVPGNATNTTDCYGHGTHVAGIIAGRTFGVAKNAALHPVRTIGCPTDSLTNQQFIDNTIRGLNWIVGEVTAQRSGGAAWPSIVNWSGGNATVFTGNNGLRTAVQSVVNNNIVLVQAAGNQSGNYTGPASLADACQLSFGGTQPQVIVAGGMDYNEGRWTRRPLQDPDDAQYCGSDCGSNGGSCIDIWSPATHVIASNKDGDNLTCHLSGTSMAAPHVAGVAAIYLQSNPFATPAQVEQALRSRGTWGALQSNASNPNYIGQDSDNVIVFSDTRSTGDTAPVAAFTSSCLGSECTFDASASTDNGAITSWTWRFGDNTTGSGAIVTHTFPPTFSGPVVLTVTDNTGKTDHLLQTITVNGTLPSPANVIATASGVTVTITWTTVSGADGYNVERKVSSGPWQLAQSVNGGGTSTAFDTPSTASGVALYRVIARAGTLTSTPSNRDAAYVGTFSNDPMTTFPPTPIKAEHITEMRRAVNGLRDIGGQGPVYTSTDLDPNVLRTQVIDDSHVTTLMANLNAARGFSSLPSVAFRIPPAPGVSVKTWDIEDLRAGVK